MSPPASPNGMTESLAQAPSQPASPPTVPRPFHLTSLSSSPSSTPVHLRTPNTTSPTTFLTMTTRGSKRKADPAEEEELQELPEDSDAEE